MLHSKQILSITSAAVNALSRAKDVQVSDKRLSLQQGSLQTVVKEDDVSRSSKSFRSSPSDKLAESSSGESKENSLSTPPSFSGTQRVRVPSRMLREIKSPLERSPLSVESIKIPVVSNTGGQYQWSWAGPCITTSPGGSPGRQFWGGGGIVCSWVLTQELEPCSSSCNT